MSCLKGLFVCACECDLIVEFVGFVICHLVVNGGIDIVSALKLHTEAHSALVLCRDDIDAL